ncbi:TetR family transcriptional regulator [Serratia sp. JSRIV001]|uniref:TetR family transcriptional regulator n=1 Tax=Serratia TaxID=613 RepID=UPI000466CAB4|nr:MULTISPECIES: TetR family transcriptional regulator [Serratia]UAN45140.1 TetR family transcriptional regulator [Serratia sp. JSRIV001]UAN50647.1 TetR family transcriptional regulator [Serratia sp. JSRIV002]UAN56604.1 TetR family transcriptional regulator [Serratia sp. JSRIV004]UAN62211.1 TetR family transcriptional regulator [Serratia sp. JSRIV006]
MARKTPEESQKTRDAILNSAERVFITFGVGESTINHISLDSGFSRGAIYGHYTNKVEICLSVIKRAIKDEQPLKHDIKSDVLEYLLSSAVIYLKKITQPGSIKNIIEIIYFKTENTDENAPILRWKKFIDRFILNKIKISLKRAVASGELPEDLDLVLCSFYLSALFEGIYDTCKWSYEDVSDEIINSLERILRFAIFNLKESNCNGILKK